MQQPESVNSNPSSHQTFRRIMKRVVHSPNKTKIIRYELDFGKKKMTVQMGVN